MSCPIFLSAEKSSTKAYKNSFLLVSSMLLSLSTFAGCSCQTMIDHSLPLSLILSEDVPVYLSALLLPLVFSLMQIIIDTHKHTTHTHTHTHTCVRMHNSPTTNTSHTMELVFDLILGLTAYLHVLRYLVKYCFVCGKWRHVLV